jgi:hypothetical protein
LEQVASSSEAEARADARASAVSQAPAGIALCRELYICNAAFVNDRVSPTRETLPTRFGQAGKAREKGEEP